MHIEQMYGEGLAIFSYMLWSEQNRQCVIIDPTIDSGRFMQIAKEHGLTVTHLLETHVHADFLSGCALLREKITPKPEIVCSALGGKEWLPSYATIAAENGFAIDFPEGKLEAFHTPGHTPEHLSWLLYEKEHGQFVLSTMFSGDFILIGSVGRPDLLGSKSAAKLAEDQFDSLFIRTKELPDHLILLPAHGAGSICGKAIAKASSSTLGQERRMNPYFAQKEKSIWCQQLLQDQTKPASYLSAIKRNNLTPQPHAGQPIILRSPINFKDYFLVDIRAPEEFANSFLPGALNIPFKPHFSNWFMNLYDAAEKRPLLLIHNSDSQCAKAVHDLHLIGIASIYCWKYQAKELANEDRSFNLIAPEELFDKLNDFYLIDVRSQDEWRQEHIADSKNIPFEAIKDSLAMLPKDKPIAVICGSGSRASIAASILEDKGFTICNIKGGMNAWKEKQLPLEVLAK